MKIQTSLCSFVFLIVLLSFTGVAGATTQTITATAKNGSVYAGTASIASSSVVTCTKATGSVSGVTTYCYIQSPGWNGLISVGQSIGTTGAGTVTLTCNGQYSTPGSGLSCAATIDSTACSAVQNISAVAKSGNATQGLAPIKASATVECTQATGSVAGVTTYCSIQSPGGGGLISTGQSLGATGAGTVALSCVGQYPATGSGGLTCAAKITQVCP